VIGGIMVFPIADLPNETMIRFLGGIRSAQPVVTRWADAGATKWPGRLQNIPGRLASTFLPAPGSGRVAID